MINDMDGNAKVGVIRIALVMYACAVAELIWETPVEKHEGEQR